VNTGEKGTWAKERERESDSQNEADGKISRHIKKSYSWARNVTPW
jgi:hypothetical protein